MAFDGSGMFTATLTDAWDGTLHGTAVYDLDTNTIKAALYNNSVSTAATAKDVTSANTAYAVGDWVVANEVDDGTNWDTGGEPITSITVTKSTGFVTVDTTVDTPQGGATTTLASVYGCLVYNDSAVTPVADQGLCFNYFGGIQGVTAGTFTIVWHANGILRFAT